MSVHPTEGDLHRHHDGELAVPESWEVEAHLAECAQCATAYDAIRRTVERVGELPESIEPPVDLWTGIAARIGAPIDELEIRRGWRDSRTRIAAIAGWVAAVAAALILGVGLGRVFPTAGPPLASGRPSIEPPGQTSVVPAAMLASYEEPTYDQAVADLVAVLDSMRDQLEPETVAVVEENLAIIDHAIAEARAALLADPANEQLHSHLSNTMQQKLKLLRVVTGAVANS